MYQLKFTIEGSYSVPSKGDPFASHAFLNTFSIFCTKNILYFSDYYIICVSIN